MEDYTREQQIGVENNEKLKQKIQEKKKQLEDEKKQKEDELLKQYEGKETDEDKRLREMRDNIAKRKKDLEDQKKKERRTY